MQKNYGHLRGLPPNRRLGIRHGKTDQWQRANEPLEKKTQTFTKGGARGPARNFQTLLVTNALQNNVADPSGWLEQNRICFHAKSYW